MQKLILKTIYDDFKKHPMRKFWYDIEVKEDHHIKWESKNRWRIGKQGMMSNKKLSDIVSRKMVNKRNKFNYREESKKNYQEFKKSGDKADLQIAHYLSYFINKPEKNWQSNSFRASFSRSLNRLADRNLINLWINKDSGYTIGVTLTNDGEHIAKKL